MGRLEAEFAKKAVALPYHVRLVAGASGGMIGMGNYVTSLQEPGGAVHDKNWPPYPAKQTVEEVGAWLKKTGVTDDWLTPITHRMLYRDLPHMLIPWMPFADRGTVMEREWERCFHGRLSTAFGRLRAQEQVGWRPSLVYTPLMVEDGRQLVVSNLDMQEALDSLGPELSTAPDRVLSVSGLHLFDLVPDAVGTFTVGTAARLSASFPFVMPAAVLPTDPPRRLVDAGYFDNYGIVIATAWLHAHQEWVKRNYSGVLIVQIRDGLSAKARTRQEIHPPEADSVVTRGLYGLTSPVSGALAARSASMTFRCDKLLDLLEHDFGGPDRGFLKIASFEFGEDNDVSLSFRLTQDEVTAIAKASLDLPQSSVPQSSIEEILDWWPVVPPPPHAAPGC
jgi:hypothetical protein